MLKLPGSLKWVLFAFLCTLSPLSHADTIYKLPVTAEPCRVSRLFEFYLDYSNSLAVGDVEKQTFFRVNKDVPNFNITKATVWGRLRLTASDTADWYMLLDPSYYTRVFIYQRTGQGAWTEDQIGTASDLESIRPVRITRLMNKLRLRAGDTLQLYLKITESRPITLDVHVGTLAAFYGPVHRMDIYCGICFGVMAMMLIYNLYLYLTNRDKIYLYYVMYVFSSMLFTAVFRGYTYHLPSFLVWLITTVPLLPAAGLSVFGLLFTRGLFRGILPRSLVGVINVFIAVALILLFFGFTDQKHLQEKMVQIMGLLLVMLSIIAGIIAFRKKHRSSVFYLVGFGAYMGSICILILSTRGFMSFTSYTWYVLITGSAIECIMLSFALGDKFRMAHIEKEKAQEESLIKSLENESLVREQNMLLEQKVKERTVELVQQKEVIGQKNREIVDSINYARRIQQTILAQESVLGNNLKEHFVLFLPKDIVSGDFYWASLSHEPAEDRRSREQPGGSSSVAPDGLFYLAVCDSTGHGVPGAFMSLLNTSFLNEAFNKPGCQCPNDIFDHVRSRLIDSISELQQKDGMDGVLIRYDKAGRKVSYAAANNRPLLIRNKEVVPLAYDKMPVGRDDKSNPFSGYEFEVQPGDALYLFTDGYYDQFGGPREKKFKYRNFVEKILEIHQQPLAEQKELLEQTFANWKGNLEQVDDVMVLGLRF